jgi:ribonuclease P protein subunit POP4
MRLNCQSILWHEIIGLGVKIVESSDTTLLGTVGTIVFETKNTIFIRKDSVVRQVAKMAAKRLQVQTPSCVCFISGSALIGRPEDRIAQLNNR